MSTLMFEEHTLSPWQPNSVLKRKRLHGTVSTPSGMEFEFHKLTLGLYVHNQISKNYTIACVAR